MEFIKLWYSFIVHAWLPLCMAKWIGIVKNVDAPSKGRLPIGNYTALFDMVTYTFS